MRGERLQVSDSKEGKERSGPDVREGRRGESHTVEVAEVPLFEGRAAGRHQKQPGREIRSPARHAKDHGTVAEIQNEDEAGEADDVQARARLAQLRQALRQPQRLLQRP